MKSIEQIRKLFDTKVLQADNIIITAHKGADDDAVASILSTYIYLTEFLKKDSKSIQMIITGVYSTRWEYFKNYDKVQFVEDIADLIEKDALLIILDARDYHRISWKSEQIKKTNPKVLCIDHHESGGDSDYDLYFSFPDIDRSSNAEILYDLFFKEFLDTLSKELCEILLLGILGDTGNFLFARPRWPTAMVTARDLMLQGDLPIEAFKSKYDKTDKETLNLLGMLLQKLSTDEVKGWPPFVYGLIEPEIKEKHSETAYDGAMGIIKHYSKSLKGYDWGFFISLSDSGEAWRLSFRSIPGCVNVRLVAEHFNGGGHNPAAGGSIPVSEAKTIEEAKELVIEYLRNNKPEFF